MSDDVRLDPTTLEWRVRLIIKQGDGKVEVRLDRDGLTMRIVSVAHSPTSPVTAWVPISLCDLAKLLIGSVLPSRAWRR